MIPLFNRRTFLTAFLSGLLGLRMFLLSKIRLFASPTTDQETWTAYLKTILPYYSRWEFEETSKKLEDTFSMDQFRTIQAHLDQTAEKLCGTTFRELNDLDRQTEVVKAAEQIDPELHQGFRQAVLLAHCTRSNGFRTLGYDEDTKSEIFICDLQYETYPDPLYSAEEIPVQEFLAIIPENTRQEWDRLAAERKAWDVSYPGEEI